MAGAGEGVMAPLECTTGLIEEDAVASIKVDTLRKGMGRDTGTHLPPMTLVN